MTILIKYLKNSVKSALINTNKTDCILITVLLATNWRERMTEFIVKKVMVEMNGSEACTC